MPAVAAGTSSARAVAPAPPPLRRLAPLAAAVLPLGGREISMRPALPEFRRVARRQVSRGSYTVPADAAAPLQPLTQDLKTYADYVATREGMPLMTFRTGVGRMASVGRIRRQIPEPDMDDNSTVTDNATVADNSTANDNSTVVNNTDTETTPKDHFPPWAAVLLGAGVAACLVVVCSKIGARLASPLPLFGASNQEKLAAELQKAQEAVQILNAAIEAARAAEIAQAEEAAREQENAARIERGEPPEEEEEEPPAPEGDTREELLGEMLVRTRGPQAALQQGVERLQPILARASHVESVFNESVESMKGRVTDMAQSEATTMYTRMQSALGVELPTELPALPEWLNFDPDDPEAPPVGLIVAGAFAPMQIRITRSSANYTALWSCVLMAACVCVCIVDRDHQCHDKMVWIWQYVFFGINSLNVLCNFIVAGRGTQGLRSIARNQERAEAHVTLGNPVWDTFVALKANASDFFKAVAEYDRLIDSWFYTIARLTGFLTVIWGAVALYITIHDVIEDLLVCDATTVVLFMHIYSFIFVVLLLWNIFNLLLWIVSIFAGTSFVTTAILKAAKQADDEVPLKLPVFLTLVRGFVLRNSADVFMIREKAVRKEILEYTEKLEAARKEAEELEAKRLQFAQTEAEYIERYTQKVQNQLAAVEPLVALAVAGMDTTSDSAAAGSAGFGFSGYPGASGSGDAAASSSSAAPSTFLAPAAPAGPAGPLGAAARAPSPFGAPWESGAAASSTPVGAAGTSGAAGAPWPRGTPGPPTPKPKPLAQPPTPQEQPPPNGANPFDDETF